MDGLTNLYSSSIVTPNSGSTTPPSSSLRPQRTSSPGRPTASHPSLARKQESDNTLLTDTSLETIQSSIVDQARQLKKSSTDLEGNSRDQPIMLILDGLDFLLAASADQPNGPNVNDMLNFVSTLQENFNSVILCISADPPLLTPSFPQLGDLSPGPIEMSHTALLTSLMHRASLTLACRELDTGVARDGPGIDETEETSEWANIDEGEFLYLVGGRGEGGGGRSTEGGVKIWRRGEGVVGG
ncbi:MAG: hypothetical protein M4579_003484 [Chaenotheca gracillima]|nr:MAG: hypothetical protein M4579_003484 [Chaenotheca gracillima]